eukprot:Pgem_evm1s19487
MFKTGPWKYEFKKSVIFPSKHIEFYRAMEVDSDNSKVVSYRGFDVNNDKALFTWELANQDLNGFNMYSNNGCYNTPYKVIHENDREKCKSVCLGDNNCISFQYNKEEKQCELSDFCTYDKSVNQYGMVDENYDLYVKILHDSTKSPGIVTPFPGHTGCKSDHFIYITYIEPVFKLIVDATTCEYACVSDKDCVSFVFNEKTKLCLISPICTFTSSGKPSEYNSPSWTFNLLLNRANVGEDVGTEKKNKHFEDYRITPCGFQDENCSFRNEMDNYMMVELGDRIAGDFMTKNGIDLQHCKRLCDGNNSCVGVSFKDSFCILKDKSLTPDYYQNGFQFYQKKNDDMIVEMGGNYMMVELGDRIAGDFMTKNGIDLQHCKRLCDGNNSCVGVSFKDSFCILKDKSLTPDYYQNGFQFYQKKNDDMIVEMGGNYMMVELGDRIAVSQIENNFIYRAYQT